MITDQQAEEIVLLTRLSGSTYANVAVALGYIAPMSATALNQLDSWDNTLKIFEAEKRLDQEFKTTHSPPTNKGA